MNYPLSVLSCATLALVAAPAHAALVDLMPGQGAGVNGTTVAADPELGGVIPLGGDVVQAFQIFTEGARGVGPELLYEGTLQSRVQISDVTSNIIFSHRILNVNGALEGVIASITVDDYSGMQTLVEWRTDTLGDVGPSRAQRSADGADVQWLFGNGFPMGDESHFLPILTDQPNYHFNGTATITLASGQSVTLPTWIPTPASASAFALAGLAALRRRR